MANKSLKELRAKLLAKPEVRAAYEEQAPGFAIAREVILARARAGLSQAELAERMHTSQPSIVRLESGRSLPSLRTLLKVAEATGSEARFELVPARKRSGRRASAA